MTIMAPEHLRLNHKTSHMPVNVKCACAMCNVHGIVIEAQTVTIIKNTSTIHETSVGVLVRKY